MRLKIKNEQDLQEHLTQCRLPPSSNVQKLARELYCMCEEGETLSLSVHTDMIAPSYLKVPAMFGQSFYNTISVPVAQSWVRGAYMYLHLGTNKVPTTFRAKGIEALKGDGWYSVKRNLVPPCYRSRPAVFTHILSEALGGERVYAIETDNRIKWLTGNHSETI